jgi:acetolactate synthase I/III small subunit
MIAQHTLIVTVEDRPGVLNRVASLFRRRGFNIDSLTVGHSAEPGVSRMTVVISTDDDTVRRLEANLYKLVNVLLVENLRGQGAVIRDLAMIKIRCDASKRVQVLQLLEVFRARAIDVSAENLIVEITGAPDKVDGLCKVLEPFGILEMVRTGAVAMTRGAEMRLSAVAA